MRGKQQDGDRASLREVVDVPDAAGLAAEAGKLPIGVIEEIGDDHQQSGDVGPAVGARHERRRARKPDSEADRGQVIGGDAARGEGRHQAPREARVPWTVRVQPRCQNGIRHYCVRLRAPLPVVIRIVRTFGASSSRKRRAAVRACEAATDSATIAAGMPRRTHITAGRLSDNKRRDAAHPRGERSARGQLRLLANGF